MQEEVYVCTGTCGGEATKEQWESGAKTCSAKDCTKHGEPLEKRNKCEVCQAKIKEGETHEH